MPNKVPQWRPPWLGPPAPAGDRHRRYNRQGRDPEQAKLYGSARWQKFRTWIKRERVLCERCQAEGRTVVGEHVHHKRDPREFPEGFLDPENVELLCASHHNAITASRRRRE